MKYLNFVLKSLPTPRLLNYYKITYKRVCRWFDDLDLGGYKHLKKLIVEAKESNKKFELSMFKYKFLEIYKTGIFLDYVEKKARKLAEEENIKIFYVPYDEMNKDFEESEQSVGLFRYIDKNKFIGTEYTEFCNLVESFKKVCNNNLIQKHIYPRIEICEKSDVFVILHELGHYFLYKKEIEQSELGANQFVEEFFDNYLPPFMKWIYQFEIEIRTKKDLEYTAEESKLHYENYLKFKEEYEQI